MSDTPKFTVVDRRKFRGDEESAPSTSGAESEITKPAEEAAPKAAPRLTLVEPNPPAGQAANQQPADASAGSVAVADEPEEIGYDDPQLPPAPSAEESRFQKAAYDKAAERLDDLVRAQNPAAPHQEKLGFEHLVQQLYLSAMMQMGAGTPEGQRPRIDILGARQTIDLLGVVLEKTVGNITPQQEAMLQTVLFELHSTFLELTRMIATQAQAPLPPPPGSKPGPNPGAKR